MEQQQVRNVTFYRECELDEDTKIRDINGNPVITDIKLTVPIKNTEVTFPTFNEFTTYVQDNFKNFKQGNKKLYVKYEYYINGGWRQYKGEIDENGLLSGICVVIERNNKDRYVGYLKGHKKHGKGTMVYYNGEKYVGEFKEGKRHGQGTLFRPTCKKKYEGEWENGLIQGNAISYFNNGKCICTWDQNVPRGNRGYFLNDDNKVTITTDKNLNIISIITTADNTIYKVDGNYKIYYDCSNEPRIIDSKNYFNKITPNDLITANTKPLTTEETTTAYFPPKGVKYVGQLNNNGKMDGKGMLSWYDFENNRILIYEGIFQDGICNNGILKIEDKERGEVKKTTQYLCHKINQTSNINDITSLPKTEKDLNKKYPIYEGDIDPNTLKPTGRGTITWPNGSTYTGEFNNGKSTEGKLVLKNGNKQQMVYQNYSRGIKQDDILNDPPKPVIDNILYFTNYSWFRTSCCNNNSCEHFSEQETDLSGLQQE